MEIRGGESNQFPPYISPQSWLALKAGGRLETGQIKLINSGLYGDGGTLQADVVNLGRCLPGVAAPTAHSFGALNIEGMYIQQGTYVYQNQTVSSSGKLMIEVGGYVAGAEHDVLNIDGSFHGGGELVLSLVTGFDPPNGAAFNIITCDRLIDSFSSLSLPTFIDDRVFVVSYVDMPDGPDLVRARVTTSCPADTNGSDHVDIEDLGAVIGNWGPCPTGVCPSDINGNSVVDVSDLLMVVNAWGECP